MVSHLIRIIGPGAVDLIVACALLWWYFGGKNEKVYRERDSDE